MERENTDTVTLGNALRIPITSVSISKMHNMFMKFEI